MTLALTLVVATAEIDGVAHRLGRMARSPLWRRVEDLWVIADDVGARWAFNGDTGARHLWRQLTGQAVSRQACGEPEPRGRRGR